MPKQRFRHQKTPKSCPKCRRPEVTGSMRPQINPEKPNTTIWEYTWQCLSEKCRHVWVKGTVMSGGRS